jgi:hypothetical protein
MDVERRRYPQGVALRENLLSGPPWARVSGKVVGCDLGAVLRRLLLFESFTVDYGRFTVVADLVEAMGVDFVHELLTEGRLALTYQDCWVGPGRREWQGPLQFVITRSGDFGSGRARALDQLRQHLNLPERSWSRLEEAVQGAVRTPIGAHPILGSYALYSDAYDASMSDLRHPSRTFERVVRTVLSYDLNVRADAALPFRLEWSCDYGEVAFETDIGRCYGINEGLVDDLLWRSLIALTTLNIRLAQAAAFRRMVSFSYRDTSLVAAKYRSLLQDVDPQIMEGSFERVIDIACLPAINHNASNVDGPTFLRVCRSREADDFRRWLREIPERRDDDIGAEISDKATKIGAALGTRSGRGARFAVTTALGFVPGVGGLLGAASGAVDAFWLDELANGAVWFVTNSYGSVFTPAER